METVEYSSFILKQILFHSSHTQPKPAPPKPAETSQPAEAPVAAPAPADATPAAPASAPAASAAPAAKPETEGKGDSSSAPTSVR